MGNCIEVKELKKCFGNFEAVKDISFQVEQGELFGFLGINGAGKSTTINMLSTLMKPTKGKVWIAGYELGKEDREIRKRIGVVFQGNTLDDLLTVKENLVSRAYLYEDSSQKVKKHVSRVCEVLEIGDLLNRKFKELSGGQKRKCEIARALLNEPEILFLDEPTTGLDPKTRKVVWESIEALRKKTHMTVFLTTHYMEEAIKAKHIAVMNQGEIIAFDTPYALKEHYAVDLLKITSTNKEKVIAKLKQDAMSYREVDNRLNIELPSTLSALTLLQSLKEYIATFEVVQGTMEDAFLNITGKSIREE